MKLRIKKLLIPLLCLTALTGCNRKERLSPIEWCVKEIYKTDGYDECAYTYVEIEPYDLISSEKTSKMSSIYAYIITTYSYPLRTEWSCFIEVKHKHSFDNAVGLMTYYEDEIIDVDCDIIWTLNYGERV